LWNRRISLIALLQIRAVHRKVMLNRPACAAAAGVEPTWVDTPVEMPLPPEDVLTVDDAIAELAAIHDQLAALPATHEASIAVRFALADMQRAIGFPKGAAQWLEAVRHDLAGLGDEARAQRIDLTERLISDLRAADDWPGIANATALLIADLESGGDLEQRQALYHRLDLARAIVQLVVPNAVDEVTELLARLAAVEAPTSDLAELEALARVDLTRWLLDLGRAHDAVDASANVEEWSLAVSDHAVRINAAIQRVYALKTIGRWEEVAAVASAAWDMHFFSDSVPSSEQTDLCTELATTFGYQGDFERVVLLLEPRLALIEQTLGPRHHLYLRAAEELARSLTNVGRAAEAVPLLERCLEVRRTQEFDAPTGWCETLLQKAAEAVGDTPRALEIATRQLARQEAVYGPHSNGALDDLRTIARLTQATDPSTSLATYEEVLRRNERKLGPSAREVQFDRLDVAHALGMAGQPERSLAMYEQVLAVIDEDRANDRGQYELAAYNVAQKSAQVGDTRRAIALYERIAEGDEPTTLAEYHVRLASVANLATAYRDADRADDAVRTAHAALAMAASRLPRTDRYRQDAERFSEAIIANGGQQPATESGTVAPDA
ncbi:MAG: tetratricopeptide repeat protein, partial [Ilumatobacteraceae bacterium]